MSGFSCTIDRLVDLQKAAATSQKGTKNILQEASKDSKVNC